jgi:hypothetical protein
VGFPPYEAGHPLPQHPGKALNEGFGKPNKNIQSAFELVHQAFFNLPNFP